MKVTPQEGASISFENGELLFQKWNIDMEGGNDTRGWKIAAAEWILSETEKACKSGMDLGEKRSGK